ncbi:MAG TPA: Do family serine endopeptidase [Candidatus Tenderia electrophaga]|uniref:Do family serine endopeptidase n=1 Tax=Candidatus Tenderia electrophaga TaxID=1748243 RepID=A0A832J3I4_9GAMM|nr:Do family serine endopeptidase [Candidatus Tenderia electrophaga]
MHLRTLVSFATEAITAGLAFAFVLLLLFKPETFEGRPSVEFIEAQSPQRTNVTTMASYANAVDTAAPAVVNIYTRKLVTQRSNPPFNDPFLRRFFGDKIPAPQKRLENSLGSGVIVNRQGFILTNNHVISDADEIEVALHDGRSIAATIVGTDPESDLAVLKIDLNDAPAIVFGQSETLRVGDIVLAIGNPFGVGQTVTSGIVSATGRSRLGLSTFENFIQTDAAINPGNSGGALINSLGQLVGINTAIFSRSGGSQGIGFAIPVSLAKGVMKQIIEYGRALRGWLGVEVQDLSPSLAESFGLSETGGALVAGVQQGGPAAAAGLQPGDIIALVNGNSITSSHSLMNAISNNPPGTTLTLDVIRHEKQLQIKTIIGERPQPQQP